MENLKIIEYDPSYAGETARMWRLSSEGWNGGYSNKTEEQVLLEQSEKVNSDTFLAVKNNEVLGYCNLKEYAEDEGALEIKLLNARFDCHGMGIGKALVKMAIERTTEAKVPRLELYTWSSNTKSIPLYKRCGFFLENDGGSHLMNFIPYVFQTEAIKECLQNIDWYRDLKRSIDMEPDGRSEEDFEFYEYNWKNESSSLRMEFERRGRGLRLIETEDYLISMSIENQCLIFGRAYKVSYKIVNKTGKPLEIEIKGCNDKNIKFDFNENINVIDTEIVDGEFFIEPIDREVNEYKTHPAVVSEIFINGKKALFKLGIIPKIPAKISLSSESIERFVGQTYKMYIDIESNMHEDAVLEFEIPENKDIKLLKRSFSIPIKKQERISLELHFILNKPTVFSSLLDVKAALKNDECISFKANIVEFIKGRDEAFGAETQNDYIIVNGSYSVILNKDYNEVSFKKFDEKHIETILEYPRLGLPYSEEFANKNAVNVHWYKEDDYMVLKADYDSTDYEKIKLTLVIKLLSNGIVESYYEIFNLSPNETADEVCIKQEVFHNELMGAFLPYDNKIIQLSNMCFWEEMIFQNERLNENWVFTMYKGGSRSLWWDKNLKVNFGEWPYIYFEHKLGKIQGNAKKVTKAVYTALTTFDTWQDLRSFVLEESKLPNINTVPEFEVTINNNNPFIKEDIFVDLIEHKQLPFNGEIIVESQNKSVCCVKKTIKDKVLNAAINTSMSDKSNIDIISIKANIGILSLHKKAAIFKIKDIPIKTEISNTENYTIYSMINGEIEIKASPDYSNGIYSLKYKGTDYIESSFPHLGMRTWFNPWFGGIQTVPRNWFNNSAHLSKEKITAEFVEIEDAYKNKWSGLKTCLYIQENDEYKGLIINDYYLMLPGIPVLCHASKFINNMGKYMKEMCFMNKNFFNINSDIIKNYVCFKEHQREITTLRTGIDEIEIYPNTSLYYGNEDVKDKLQIYTDYDKCMMRLLLNDNDNFCGIMRDLNMAHGESLFTNPTFYIFTKEHIPDKLLKCLNNIRF